MRNNIYLSIDIGIFIYIHIYMTCEICYQGAAMMPYSTLLEHTLVLGGDVVDEGDTMQGWPAEPVGIYSPFWRCVVWCRLMQFVAV